MKRPLQTKNNEPQQRICVTFSRGHETKYISHLDMMRLWQRALRRAGMPLAYSQGFHPQARISIAAPLAVGVTSQAELMDVFLGRRVDLDFFARAVAAQLPEGVGLENVKQVWPGLASLQSQLRFAEYSSEVESARELSEVGEAIRSLLGETTLAWQHSRGQKVHKYDLRALIDDIWIIGFADFSCTLGMRLCSDLRGSGRPEQVLLALGFEDSPKSIHRTGLVMANS